MLLQNYTVGDGAVMRGHVEEFVVLFRDSFFFFFFFSFFFEIERRQAVIRIQVDFGSGGRVWVGCAKTQTIRELMTQAEGVFEKLKHQRVGLLQIYATQGFCSNFFF